MNVLKTLNDTLGNGCVCGAAETIGRNVAKIAYLNDSAIFAAGDKAIAREHKVEKQLRPRY
jgi:hypothetical protein